MGDEGWTAVRHPVTELPVEGDLNIWMNWWQHPEQPDRIHVPVGDKVFNVKAVFLRPWVILLSGEAKISSNWPNPDLSGMNTGLRPLLEPCYWVEFFDEDVVNGPEGDGELYELLHEKMKTLQVKSIAMIGHSHGGGSIYNFLNLLQDTDPEHKHNKPGIRKPTAIFAGYVDAIKEEGYTVTRQIWLPPETVEPMNVVITTLPDRDMRPENRCPSAGFRANFYQEKDRMLRGTRIDCSANPNWDINCLHTVSVNHGSIDDDPIVTAIMKNRLDSVVYNHDRLSITEWGHIVWPCE